MNIAAKPLKQGHQAFEKKYRSALRAYAAHASEAGLIQAYELGREAMENGKSLLEIASIHHETQLACFKEADGAERRVAFLRASADFFRESLSPYEMANRGFQDAVKALRQLNEMLEEKIKRVAHAVHDEAGQLLVAVHLALADLSRGLANPQQEQLQAVEGLLQEVEQQLRSYSHELRPTILDDLGWIPAVRFLAERVTRRANLPIEIKGTLKERLPGDVEITLYRVVQEALNNATKHAKASRVVIRVRRSSRTLSCLIQDDGTGFELRAVQSDTKRSGLGLVSMKERLSAIGGTLTIDSAPGRGTRLLIRVPVQ
jgi:signal transduction histidine kinase